MENKVIFAEDRQKSVIIEVNYVNGQDQENIMNNLKEHLSKGYFVKFSSTITIDKTKTKIIYVLQDYYFNLNIE